MGQLVSITQGDDWEVQQAQVRRQRIIFSHKVQAVQINGEAEALFRTTHFSRHMGVSHKAYVYRKCEELFAKAAHHYREAKLMADAARASVRQLDSKTKREQKHVTIIKLHEAVVHKEQVEARHLLFEKLVHPDAGDMFLQTPLHWVATLHQDLIMARILVEEADANVNAKDGVGMAPLQLASLNLDSPVFEYLLEHGADPEQEDNNGWRAIHFASHAGNTLAIHFLINRGVDMNAVTDDGDTAAIIASREGKASSLAALAARHANLYAKNSSQQTARMVAAGEAKKYFQDLEAGTLIESHDADAADVDPDGVVAKQALEAALSAKARARVLEQEAKNAAVEKEFAGLRALDMKSRHMRHRYFKTRRVYVPLRAEAREYVASRDSVKTIQQVSKRQQKDAKLRKKQRRKYNASGRSMTKVEAEAAEGFKDIDPSVNLEDGKRRVATWDSAPPVTDDNMLQFVDKAQSSFKTPIPSKVQKHHVRFVGDEQLYGSDSEDEIIIPESKSLWSKLFGRKKDQDDKEGPDQSDYKAGRLGKRRNAAI